MIFITKQQSLTAAYCNSLHILIHNCNSEDKLWVIKLSWLKVMIFFHFSQKHGWRLSDLGTCISTCAVFCSCIICSVIYMRTFCGIKYTITKQKPKDHPGWYLLQQNIKLNKVSACSSDIKAEETSHCNKKSIYLVYIEEQNLIYLCAHLG